MTTVEELTSKLDDPMERRQVATVIIGYLFGATIWTLIISSFNRTYTWRDIVFFGNLLFTAALTYHYGVHLRILETVWKNIQRWKK